MTQSYHSVREHILEFDDNFERTLRRNRNQQNRNPPIPEPEFEEYLKKKRNIPTWQRTIEQSRSFPLRDWTMSLPYASNTPWLP
ncbi:hypothetical protein ACFX2I_001665 [Malus domestica]